MASCFDFKKSGSCKYGDKCRFPHITEDGETVSGGDREKSTGPPQAGVDGNWACTSCGNVNFFHRHVCNRCNAQRSYDDGSWACPSCKNLNYPYRDACNRCKAARPPAPPMQPRPGMGGMGGMGGGMMGMGGPPMGGGMGGGGIGLDLATRQFLSCFSQSPDPIDSGIQHLMSLRSPGNGNYAPGAKRTRFEQPGQGGYDVGQFGYNAPPGGYGNYPPSYQQQPYGGGGPDYNPYGMPAGMNSQMATMAVLGHGMGHAGPPEKPDASKLGWGQ